MCFVNYSYLAIRLERSASFASLIRLYVNSGFSFVWLIRMQHVALVSQNKKMCYLRHNSGNMGHKIYNNSNNFNQQLPRQSKAPQNATSVFWDPAIPGAAQNMTQVSTSI